MAEETMPPLSMRNYQIRWWDGMTIDIRAVRVEVACAHAQRERHEKNIMRERGEDGRERFWRELKVRASETPIIACVEV